METNIINVEYRTKEIVIAEVKATIEHVATTAMLGAIKIGRCYQELKELVPHGEWYKYIEENIGHTPKKVERFMKIASKYGDDSTPLGSLFAKTTISSDLSVYKALTLIALPDEEAEDFVENNDIENLTVKELEKRIKDLQEENKDIKEKLKESTELEKAKDDMEASLLELKTKIAELELEEAQEPSEEIKAEIEKHKADLKKAEKKLDDVNKKNEKLQQEIKDLKESQAKAIEEARTATAEEAKEAAKKEVEEEMTRLMTIAEEANRGKLDAEKKLASSSDADLMRFKFTVDQLQSAFNEAIVSLENIKAGDQEKGDKLRAGLCAILEQLQERL